MAEMEEGNPQKSTFKSNLFEIPIEEFEECLISEAAKEKKNEILELFKNNNLSCKEEFDEIKYDLKEFCIEGDVELIKLF